MTQAPDVPGWRPVYSGKVRDLYESADGGADTILVVASDRVSAFDYALAPDIPDKGVLLTTLSLWWFDRLSGTDGGSPIANHLVPGREPPKQVAGRAMVVQKLNMLPVECVVRGYLTGSGFAEYERSGTVCGIPVAAGLSDGDRLPEPLFTPAYKAPMGEHDENITFERVQELVGHDDAHTLRDLSLEIYRRAAATASERGLILADTKFEFGRDDSGAIILADEALTSDSSRYWDAATWESAATAKEKMASFDKQIVRDWLSAHWDRTGEPPELPADVVAATAAKYRELLDRLR